ncbi:DUF427-domain-containing protein [Hypoxylon sp. NC1633]|nr:DUF427-domain-containing protein [Hypoxylon sp. NC1633]
MASPHVKPDLLELGKRLVEEGPVKTLATPRRVRILFNGVYIADTTAALYVWEHQYYPFFYLPADAFPRDALKPNLPPDESESPPAFWTAELRAGTRSTVRVLGFGAAQALPQKSRALAGLVRVEFGAADAWFEEDTRIYVHPKDPFRRVDVLHSARRLRVRVRGELVADALAGWHLYETGLPARYYVPATAVVDARVLRDSGTTTACPYKGVANYYHVAVGGGDGDGSEGKGKGELLEDLVWYYRTPTLECAEIAGCLCFYHEREGVEIELDGKVVPKPKTPWS